MKFASCRRTAILLYAFALVSLAGCFRSPDMTKLSCTTSAHCPEGYQCVARAGQAAGICEKAVDGGGPDMFAPTDVVIGIDIAPAVDHAPAVDIVTSNVDGPVTSDVALVLDMASPLDTPPDAPGTPDLGPDLAPDVPTPADTAQDNPAVPPDVSPDLTPDLAPFAPDLGPDLSPLKPLGASCTLASECADNFCAGGVCCNRSCTGECEQCTAASGGQCNYRSGTQCLAATSCANAAACSGSSATCPAPTLKPVGTVCGNATCTGSTQSGPTCNSAGSCVSGTKECYPYACVQGSGCNTSCTTNADCVSGNSSFCGKNGVCTVDAKCWHATDGSSAPPLWQVNPKEASDPDNGPWNPQYHRYDSPGSTPDDVCAALNLCGFDDWRVPTISELRSLLWGCPSTVTGGACGVTDTCLATDCDTGCNTCDNGAGPGPGQCYWPVGINGPCSLYWSSSVYFDSNRQSYRYRFIGFSDGNLWSCDPSDGNYVRCVRR